MPTYDYECNGEARHRFEQFQRFSDPPVAECHVCGASVRRVIHATGVIFKGPGFYKTDNAPKSAKAEETSPAEKTESKANGEGGDKSGPEKQPAPASSDD